MRLDPAHFLQAVGNQVPRVPFALNRASPQAYGLTADWPLFAGPAAGLRDLGYGGNHLSLASGSNTPSWVTTELGGSALDFDGTNDKAIIGTAFDPGPLPLTFECSFRAPSGFTSQPRAMFSKRDDVTASTARIDIGLYTTGAIYIYEGTNRRDSSTYTVTAGVWTDLTVTIDASGTATVYEKGISKGGFTGAVTLGTKTTSEARIGNTNDAFLDPFLGQIQHMRFYNRVLSAAEIFARSDPAVRWGLYRESRVPRVWPKAAAGGAVSRTAIGSLDAAIRAGGVNVGGSLDAAIRAAGQTAGGSLDAAIRTADLTAGGSLDAAIRTADLTAGGSLDAAIRAAGQTVGGTLDAVLAIRRSAGGTLDAKLRGSRAVGGTLDAIIGAPSAPTGSYRPSYRPRRRPR